MPHLPPCCPLYALLVVKGVARWWSALLLAALRARVVAAPAPCIGGVAVWLGAITALLVHGRHRRTRLGLLCRAVAGVTG